jgi:hypothetical protein
MMPHTNMLRRIYVTFGVIGKEKCEKTYLRKHSYENYIGVKIAPSPTSNLL